MFLKVGAALLLLATVAGGGQKVDLQLRLEGVEELGWRAVMANPGREERVFLVHEGLQPCELMSVAEGKGTVKRLDWRAVMTMDGTAYASWFKSVPAGGEVVMAEGTFVRREGRYGMSWGDFRVSRFGSRSVYGHVEVSIGDSAAGGREVEEGG